MKHSLLAALLLLALALPAHGLPAGPWLDHRPKLLVVLVIDQFRADYLTRFASRFRPARSTDGAPGGFRWLLESGAYFPFAEHDILQAMTAPGHATVLSGAWPARTGMPLNWWYDRAAGRMTYCVEDAGSPMLGGPPGAKNAVSPRHLRGGTLGDELKNAGGPAHVVALALKDRAAVLMGGHRADAVVWFDAAHFRWTTSKFYAQTLPPWLEALNGRIAARKGQAVAFRATGAGSPRSERDQAFERDAKSGEASALRTPLGLELTVEAAEAALDAEQLGTHAATDLLAVSFSTHDVLGHEVGANSRAMEELVLAEDAAIARLLGALQRKVPGGLSNVVIALTGDHGVTPDADYAQGHRLPAGRTSDAKLQQAVESALQARFGKGQWVLAGIELNLWLDRVALGARWQEALILAKTALLAVPGVAEAVTEAEVRTGQGPTGPTGERLARQYVPGRSGDLVTILAPWWSKDDDFAGHMTGYSYDRMVPLVLVGAGIQPGVYATRALAVDLTPTLAFFAGVLPPPMSEGRVLAEILAP